jgi:sugar/nucleoside kinase (ribokinase family)
MIIDLIGDVLWDTYLAVPHLPAPGKEARATSRRRSLGGTASHVARWLHLLELAGLYSGTPPALRIWTVLDIEAASALPYCDTSVCPLAPQISEVYALTRPDGEKAMISLVPPDLPPRPLPTSSACFYLSAYTLLAPDAKEQIVEPCERLVARGAQMIFDLAPLAHQMDRALARRLIGRARIALGNDGEWLEVFKTSSIEETMQAALALGAGSVHIKRGEHGSILACADGSGAAMAAAPCQPINSTGAGDAYTAAALAALVAGRSDHWAQRLATFCGALHTEQRSDSENITALQHFLAAPEG